METEFRRKLFDAVQTSYRSLQPAREEYKRLVRSYHGHRYMRQTEDEMTRTPRYLNLIYQAVEAYTTMLVGPSPQAHLSAIAPDLKPFARHFGQALNNHMDDIEMGDKLEDWIRRSFFGIGIGKVFMGESGQVIVEDDISMDPGEPYFAPLSLDDWVHDVTANSWGEVDFEGDMYQLPMEDLREGAREGIYDRKALKGVTAEETKDEGERVEEHGREIQGNADLYDKVNLIDIYMPRERTIYTFYVANRSTCELKGPPLRKLEWYGTEKGPYKKIGFAKVPDNIMPIPMVSMWEDLDREINVLFRKIIKQSRRSRQIVAYTPAAKNDVTKLTRTADGAMVEVTNLDGVEQMTFGQIDGSLFAMVVELMKLFDRFAGNLQALLGLGTSADTVGQEKLIHATVGQQGEAMQAKVVVEVRKVMEELAYMLWNDEFKEIPGSITLEGFPDMIADSSWVPGDREGLFSDYKIQCDVYSLRSSTPVERMQMIEGVLQRMIVPLMPLLQQQGGTVDMAELVTQISELMNLPRLKDIVKILPVDGESSAPARNDAPTKPPVSNRTYTRRNVSGDNGQMNPNAVSQAQTVAT